MLTPQEVSEKVFPKASFGGYHMVSVDEFLDTLTEDYTALYKDNATLKAKLKVLAEKIEEYRATEDAMRSTLLTAQKMASRLVQEAQVEKQQILNSVQEEAARHKSALDAELLQTEQKLALAQQKLADFIARSQELCANQAAFLQTLPEIDLTPEQPREDDVTTDTVRLIGQDILKSYDENAAKEEPAAEEALPTEADFASDETPVIEAAPVAEKAAEEVDAPKQAASEPFTVDFNLDDLKFGRNYNN